VDSIAFASGGHTVLTTSKLETHVRRWSWDPQTGRVFAGTSFEIKPGADTMLAVASDGNHGVALGTNTLDQNLTVRSMDDDKHVHLFKDGLTAEGGFGIISSQVVITPTGSRLLSSHENGQIILWDNTHAKDENEVPIVFLGMENPGAIAISPDGEFALTVANPKHSVLLWDLRDPKKPTHAVELNSYPDDITDVAFSSDGQSAALRDARGKVRFWNVHSPDRGRTLDWAPADPNSPPAMGMGYGLDRVGQGRLAFSPDGSQIATIDPQNHVALWDTRTGRLRRLNQPAAAHSLAFSPDGSTLAIGGIETFCLQRVTPGVAGSAEPQAHAAHSPASPPAAHQDR
jgi:WD40 repeat protein